jgi:hypothetical protein
MFGEFTNAMKNSLSHGSGFVVRVLDYVTPEYEEKCHPLGSDF